MTTHRAPLACAAFFGLVATTGTVAACDYPNIPSWMDKPIKIESDCSFVNGGDQYSDLSAGPAVLIGGGKVGQRFTFDPKCTSISEHLTITDCTTGKTLTISGQPDPSLAEALRNQQNERSKDYKVDREYGYEMRVANLYPPAGTIRLTASASLSSLQKLAERSNYTHWMGSIAEKNEHLSTVKLRNRYNPNCGCEFFDLADAKPSSGLEN